jgi:hypothetical protein
MENGFSRRIRTAASAMNREEIARKMSGRFD